MTTFDGYARYYDLVYRDKPYGAEVGYILDLAARHGTVPATVLELGVGTGAHAEHFLAKGLSVHGVDLSERMLEEAAHRRAGLPSEQAARFELTHGDVRTVNVQRSVGTGAGAATGTNAAPGTGTGADETGGARFDLVVSLFHVMSYQIRNEDIIAAFRTARRHLKDDGVFIFDCWHGPGVLTEPPETRVKQLEDDVIQATRTARPVLHVDRNSVDVNYAIRIQARSTGEVTNLDELHQMRYFFQPELRQYLELAELRLLAGYGWMGDGQPGREDWTACFVAAPR